MHDLDPIYDETVFRYGKSLSQLAYGLNERL